MRRRISKEDYKAGMAALKKKETAAGRIYGKGERGGHRIAYETGRMAINAGKWSELSPQEQFRYNAAVSVLSVPQTVQTDGGIRTIPPSVNPDGSQKFKQGLVDPAVPASTYEKERVQERAQGEPSTLGPVVAGTETMTDVEKIEKQEELRVLAEARKEQRADKDILQKKEVVFAQVGVALDRFDEKLEEFGMEVWPGANKGELSSAYMTMLMQMKEFLNLGVLNGPDMMVIKGMVMDPTDPTTALYGGAEGILRQTAAVRDYINQHRTDVKGIYAKKDYGLKDGPGGWSIKKVTR